jgi:hypothetical protein
MSLLQLQVRLLCVFAASSAVSLLAVGNTASAQHFGGDSATLTQEQLDKCEEYGINPCTQNGIVAKERLMAAQAVEATNSVQVITIDKVTDNQRYEAHITWTPDEIGKTNSFRVTLFDPKELGARQPLNDNYDLKIYQDDRNVVPSKVVSFPNGTTEYSVAFPYRGAFTLAVEIDGAGERIEMPIQVTPEFPVAATISIAAVGAVVAVVIVGRGRLAWYPSKY